MSKKTPILIIGAGPSGLAMALWLRKRNQPFRIIDKSEGPGETSRALAVQARTLELYRQMNMDEALIAGGITADSLTLRRNGKIAARAFFGAAGKGVTPFPYLLFCAQDIHEKLLVTELENLGVKIERKTELIRINQDENSVSATLRGPLGEESITVDYLCGCDGAHSFVRRELGIEFPGGTYSQMFFVADVKASGAMAEHGIQTSVSRDGFCIVMPIKSQNSVRLVGIVPKEVEQNPRLQFSDVEKSVGEITGLTFHGVNWFSTYHVHHRVAERFQLGRVFLVGDAGHIHSPAGGQGMNTGIGDAINLAWKLADVIQNRAHPKLLETYSPERMAFAKVLVKSTDTAFRLIATRSKFGSFIRTYIFPKIFEGLTQTRIFTRFAIRVLSQIRIHYRESSLSKNDSSLALKLQAGDRLPWIETADNFLPLKSMDWQIHVYGNPAPELSSLPIFLHTWRWNEKYEELGFAKNVLYLIRPDGHIAFVSRAQSITAMKSYCEENGLTILNSRP